MSDIPADFDLREQIARIDNLREEALKFAQEQHKLAAESLKFAQEQHKLAAESRKLDRERLWFPWLQLLTLATSSAAIGAIVARLLH